MEKKVNAEFNHSYVCASSRCGGVCVSSATLSGHEHTHAHKAPAHIHWPNKPLLSTRQMPADSSQPALVVIQIVYFQCRRTKSQQIQYEQATDTKQGRQRQKKEKNKNIKHMRSYVCESVLTVRTTANESKINNHRAH